MVEINNKTKSKINLGLVKKTVNKFLQSHELAKSEVSIAFVGDSRMQELNKKYRKKNKATDVLSFSGENNFLGEIVIDYAQIKRQARQFGGQAKKFEILVDEELVFILVHGLLHLLGYDDKTGVGQKEMEKLGNEYLKIKDIK